ncbi:hypothetical protein [Prevotella denticola]|uniref:hypothetical protein n=1 Tax=Prevotella denticola TaxID=28129 RepID=UPI001BAE2EE0|nr:hypothetical protein [Prevotella denticola]QUB90126.1 hypothetical protein J4855_07665 [Prevotella denticola]
MRKNIITVLSVLLVIGAIAMKFMGPKLVKEAIKSEYKNKDRTTVDSESEAEEEISSDSPLTFKLEDRNSYRIFTLYPDGTAKELDNETLLNWQEMEGSSRGETSSFIYVYEMEDTSKPRYILADNGTGYVFHSFETLDEFVTGHYDGDIDGDISANLLVSAIKRSQERYPERWHKYIYKEGEEI